MSEPPKRRSPLVLMVLALLLPVGLTVVFLPAFSRRAPDEPPPPSATQAPAPPPSSGPAAPWRPPRRPVASASASGASSIDGPDLLPPEEPPKLGMAAETLVGKTKAERRLIRAENTLEHYLEQTRYPFTSQPISRHRGQEVPNFVPSVKRPLAKADKKPTDAKVTLNQDRSIMQGDEVVTLRVHCENSEGPQPCVFVQPPVAFVREGQRDAEKIAPVQVPFAPENNDPSDQIARFAPAKKGFASYEGPIIIEGHLKIGEEEGSTSWQVTYTPAAPAIFTKKFREAIEQGSLSIYVGIQVDKPGRYVITARGASKDGKLFAFMNFNEELPRGVVEAKLQIFGKLVHDEKAEAPFKIRDVEGFLLRDGGYPDRELMALMSGDVYTTKAYALKDFSQAEWESEEKKRNVDHFKEEVAKEKDAVEKERKGEGGDKEGQKEAPKEGEKAPQKEPDKPAE